MRRTGSAVAAAVLAGALLGCTSGAEPDAGPGAVTPDPTAAPEAEDRPFPAPVAAGETGPWDVCHYAERLGDPEDLAPAADRYTSNIRTACDQVRAGDELDRPDLVACYARSDEPGGLLAGAIPTETCDQMALSDEVTPLESFDDLTRRSTG